MRLGKILLLGIAATLSISAHANNIALGKNVTLEGTFGNSSSPASTITDGVFLPQYRQWQTGTVWWNNGSQHIVIDLKGNYLINEFVVQVDDNDSYLLEYLDPSSATWKTAWNIPNYDYYNGVNVSGMQTRPNPYDNSIHCVLTNSLLASSLRLSSASGDGCYSASEVQAFGTQQPVPDGGLTLSLLGMAFAGLHLIRRKI